MERIFVLATPLVTLSSLMVGGLLYQSCPDARSRNTKLPVTVSANNSHDLFSSTSSYSSDGGVVLSIAGEKSPAFDTVDSATVGRVPIKATINSVASNARNTHMITLLSLYQTNLRYNRFYKTDQLLHKTKEHYHQEYYDSHSQERQHHA